MKNKLGIQQMLDMLRMGNHPGYRKLMDDLIKHTFPLQKPAMPQDDVEGWIRSASRIAVFKWAHPA